MRNLRGKRVLITGGARGIGLALGLRFAAEKSEVILADLDEKALPGAEESIRAAGGRSRAYALDVTDTAAIDRFRDLLHREAGPVDLIVNNAGVVFGGPFLEVPLEWHLLTYRVNVFGLVSVTRAFLPDLISRPEGHIVNIASASGFIGLPYGATYASSKWAAIGFSESLRLELAQQGHRHVRVLAVCPSYVDTGLFDGARPPRTTRMLTPDRLAAKVVRSVRRDRARLLTPWLVKITPAVKALLPTPAFDRVSSLFGVTRGMAGWRGH